MADLELVLLTKPHVTHMGTPLNGLAYNKSLALLAYLATTGVAHSREELAGLLWGEMPDQRARANLRKVLSELNDNLPSHLVVSRQTVAFNQQSSHWVDAGAFQARLQDLRWEGGKEILGDHELRLLSEAVDIYRGDFLAGFYVRDAPAFEEWVLTQRERYRQLLLNALHVLAKHHTARGAYGAGIDYTLRLLMLEPWHEEFHQQMMILLALSGQRSAAIRQYEICRTLLDTELGVEPSPDTKSLLKRIQAGQLTVPSVPAIPPHNLPTEVTPFVGRQAELHAVAEHLRDPHCRLLTLVGMSGSGKTRLALRAAYESLADFRDGSVLVAVNTNVPAELPLAIVESLGFPSESGQDTAALLLGYLRDKRVLLILDSMEQLLDGGEIPILMEILRCAPEVKIMATSLERLALEGEWVLPIRGLESSEGLTADAAQLFLTGALRAQAGFVPSDRDLDSITRICQAVEGLPVAIELASLWVQALSIEEIAEEIPTDVDFLATTSRSLPERHRSLRATLAYSCRRLSDQEQRTLSKLSVFRGGFSREAAGEVSGASLPFLALLVDRCQLQRTSPGRYAMHPSMSQYGSARLAEDYDEESATRRRHCAYYLTELEQWWCQWRFERERGALDVIAHELENIESAWQWAQCQSPNGMSGRFAEALTKIASEPPPDADPTWLSITQRIRVFLAAGEPKRRMRLRTESECDDDPGNQHTSD